MFKILFAIEACCLNLFCNIWDFKGSITFVSFQMGGGGGMDKPLIHRTGEIYEFGSYLVWWFCNFFISANIEFGPQLIYDITYNFIIKA